MNLPFKGHTVSAEQEQNADPLSGLHINHSKEQKARGICEAIKAASEMTDPQARQDRWCDIVLKSVEIDFLEFVAEGLEQIAQCNAPCNEKWDETEKRLHAIAMERMNQVIEQCDGVISGAKRTSESKRHEPPVEDKELSH